MPWESFLSDRNHDHFKPGALRHPFHVTFDAFIGHPEERLNLSVIPRSASDEGSLGLCHHFPPYSQLQIPHIRSE
jgi:hypothetical protein